MANSTNKKPNYGKRFEQLIAKQLEAYPNTTIDRIPDQTMGFKGRKNVSDFIVYHYPYIYYIECKTVHGNRLPFANISQFDALLEKQKTFGVKAGILCWWVDRGITRWLPIGSLNYLRNNGAKSVAFSAPIGFEVKGTKKRTYFEYIWKSFFY